MVRFALSLLDVFFPKFCFNCRALGSYICNSCKKKIMILPYQTCPYCEKESLYGLTHGVCARLYGVDGVISVFLYDGILQKTIKAIKFRRIRGGINALIDCVPNSFWHTLFECSDIFFKATEILAVPLHIKRYRERGFNQSDSIADAIAIILQKNITRVVIRGRYTRPQSQLATKVERYINIHGAFILNPNLSMPKKVLIIDDVWTTGATAKEIALVLKQAGVERVYVLTLARRPHMHSSTDSAIINKE